MKSTRWTSVLLTLLLVLAIVAPVSGDAESAGDPYADLPMEVSITILDRAQVPASEGSYEMNRWVEYINENSPVTVTIVPVTRTESVSKMNALFASGSAPDLVWEYGKDFMDNMYTQGVLQPVGEYIEKYSVEYKQYLEDHPELMPYLMVDGEQYGMTSARNIEGITNHAMWIRQDWLTKFGMETPQTLDDVIEYMRRVKEEDPDGNGIDDTYGLGFNYNREGILRTLFGEPDRSFMLVDDAFVDWTSTDGYRDYLAFMAMCYQEGYIDPEFITDDQYARQRQLLVTGKTGIYLGSWNMEAEWREIKENVPEAEWVPFEPFETPYGRNGLSQATPENKVICMNKDAKNPKACIALIDWLVSEGWFALTFGEENVHYRLVDGIPQTIDSDLFKEQVAYAYEMPVVDQYQPTYEWFPIRAAQDELSQAYVQVKILSNQTALKNPFRRDIPYPASSENITRYNTEISQRVTTIETNIFVGSTSVEDGLAEINAYKTSNGWEEINAEKNAWYQENKAFLQQVIR